MRTFDIHVAHDVDTKLWWVERSDIPGLNVEAPSFEMLLEIIADAAPELMAFNLGDADGEDTPIPLAIRHVTHARRVHHV